MNKKTVFTNYLEKLSDVALRGDAREESFYQTLAEMVGEVALSSGHADVHITTLPKPTDVGNPDFRLWNGTDRIIGYIEAKKPTEESLDPIEDSEQLRRYRSTFPNLILTNFLEFRLYRDGQRVQTVLSARPLVLNRLRTVPPIEKTDELAALLDKFLSFSLPRVFTAESLAIELAKRTRFLRDVVAQQLAEEREEPGMLSGFFEAFKTFLIGTLTIEDFADLFAQTITYGMFTARTRAGKGFSRRAAFDNIPHTIGVLRDLFRFISLGDLPEQLAWCVDDIAEVLGAADASGILDHYYHEGKGSDPIVHFYETFLAQYDPAERERRGVYYTPEPVVSYIVRSLHSLLKSEFGKPDGLASDGVTLLDPAAGTMTFVAKAAQQAVREFETKYGTGAREDFIRRHILKNFYAFELMMAPYAVGHLKMAFFLEELGHRLADNERMPFYLTNTLDTEELEQSKLPGFSALAEESRLAGKVKRQTPILVILGNPPYSINSTNKGEWIVDKIGDYMQVDGKPLGEQNSKVLYDDYVKFLRFAQWKIEQAGRGVVGMITNHGYLDNPTFRGMRQSLMRTYDDIFVLDLHGNSLKKETCPDGTKDANVFDIRQGVAIVFFIKRGGKQKGNIAVNFAELWGLREQKYDWLSNHDIKTTEWWNFAPKAGFYPFVPRTYKNSDAYQRWPNIPKILMVNSTGIKTHRDHFVFDFDREALKRRIRQFRDRNITDDYVRVVFNLSDTRDWKMSEKRKKIADDVDWEDKVIKCLYRPFDKRWIFYHNNAIELGRQEIMHHMLSGENLALCVGRAGQVVGPGEWNLVYCANTVEDTNCFYRGGSLNLPLYLYPTGHRDDLFTHLEPSERRPNLNSHLVSTLSEVYAREPAPEEIFHYIYAVLYAPAYREKYAEFLRMDFPRVPFTSDAALFSELAALGARLTALHLLKSPELDTPSCRFEGEGDNRVAKGKKAGLRYVMEEMRVYINSTQYFAPVPEVVWTYQIGGYQVCEKWLKDRTERRLELDDIRTYCRIVTALKLTMGIQEEIDSLYLQAENQIIPFFDPENNT